VSLGQTGTVGKLALGKLVLANLHWEKNHSIILNRLLFWFSFPPLVGLGANILPSSI